jgi:hypothetical protein
MAMIAPIEPDFKIVGANLTVEIVVRERQKSLMLRAWILSGLFFMALPGTLLGFSNLMAISAHHGLAFLPAAWMEGHGHAQMFGWIGSFILGIGFYSQPARDRSAIRIQLICFVLWTSGVAMRWTANIYAWHWRWLFPISAGFELIVVLLFLAAASRHKLPEPMDGKSAKTSMELWMISVLLGTAGLAGAVIFNFVECLNLAIHGAQLSFPHALDQKYLVLLGWGFLVPVVWGFSARWLPSFLAIAKPDAQLFRVALVLDWTVLSSQYSITQRSPVNPNGYRSARICPGFSSVWGPIGKRRKILGWWHGERLRQPVLMAGALGSWF